MGDISTWSPVDESNTAAPPNGWPENQPTNTVNNCARAMMGAVRRWYDTVTAQLASLTSSLANYLPLAGGTLTGGLSALQYKISGVTFADRDSNYHYVYDADGTASLILGAAATGYQNLYRAENHRLQSNNGAVTFATFDAGGLALTGNMTATVNITANGNINAPFGTITGDAVNSDGNMAAAGNVTGGNLISNGNLTVAGGGNVVGTLTAGAFSSNSMLAGNLYVGTSIDCDGNCEAVSYTRNGVPMVMLTEVQLDRIEARIAALERRTSLAQQGVVA
jgi:hypothetical protein